MFVCEQRLTLHCFKIDLKQKLPLYNVHITVHCALVQCTDEKDDKSGKKKFPPFKIFDLYSKKYEKKKDKITPGNN